VALVYPVGYSYIFAVIHGVPVMKILTCFAALLLLSSTAFAEPKVVVLPFEPVMDSLYGVLGGKESVLNYQKALQEMLAADLSKNTAIRVVDNSEVTAYMKAKPQSPATLNSPALAAQVARDLNADYAVIGCYGEYSHEIRLDARIVLAAMSDVPPGNAVSSTVKLWDDLPTAATQLADLIAPIIVANSHIRPVSKGVLYPEGELAAFDPTGQIPPDQARLDVWVNAPAPEIRSKPGANFVRCERVDLMNTPIEKQRSECCKVAAVPAGPITIRVIHRGYLPFEQTLDLSSGKAYRLEVDLKPIDVPVR
jgi:TolB-like protein